MSHSETTRRAFLASSLVAPVAAPALAAANEPLREQSTVLTVDYPKLVAKADLTYDKPVSRSEEGLPVGNGRMGTLVWTTGSALKFQINRPDEFAMDSSTNSFAERHTDYGSGCGFVDIDFIDAGDDVFAAAPSFRQHLSVYDGVITAQGKGVTARVIAWHDRDVLAVEIDDQRERPLPINVDLRMLRYQILYEAGKNWELTSEHTVLMRRYSHSAASKLAIQNGRIALVQEYREDRHYCSSAVVIAATGRKAKASYANESTVRLTVAPGKGRFTVLIASASRLHDEGEVAGAASEALDAAAAKGFDALLTDNRAWWREFWSRSFVNLHSADGVADFVGANYTYFQYVVASTSRGAWPARFGGLLFFTNGDMREWGSQHWFHNMSCYQDALPPTNRFELMDPMYSFYTSILPACETAARQQWGSQGAHIPETTWFNGPEPMPEDIAAEMRDLYLLRKSWGDRSQRFREFADTKHPHNSRWNWKAQGRWVAGKFEWKDKGAGPFGEVNHIYSSGVKIAHLYWVRYLYTGDRDWLRDRAYPLIKDVAEFYRNHPKVQKGDDAKYHIHDVNDHEPIKGAQDTLEEITAMRYIFPIAARASDLLGVDADLRDKWREYAANIAPIPTNDLPDSIGPRQPGEPRMWSNGRKPVIMGGPTTGRDHLLIPAIHYDLVSAATDDAEVLRVAKATFESVYPGGTNENSVNSVLSRAGLAAAHLGRSADVRHLVPNQIRSLRPDRDFCDWVGGGKTGVLRNRLTIREGPGAIDAQRLGRAAATMHLALLQGVPRAPGEDPVIHLFPAWPPEWNVEFTLLTAGGFLVTASMRDRKVEFVEFRSRIGGECRVRNPWRDGTATIYRDGKEAGDVSGPLLRFDTRKGETVVLVAKGTAPAGIRRTVA
jgi:hypothetical protein